MLNEKLSRFAQILESDQIKSRIRANLDCEANIVNCKVNVTVNRKYVNIDIGPSGRYMIDKETEEIFAIKAYGVPHKMYRFGTLDTIDKYFWGDYRAVKWNDKHDGGNLFILSVESVLESRKSLPQNITRVDFVSKKKIS